MKIISRLTILNCIRMHAYMVTGGYSGLQVTGMTEWGQKLTSPKNNLFIEKQKTSLDQKLAPPQEILRRFSEP